MSDQGEEEKAAPVKSKKRFDQLNLADFSKGADAQR